MAVIEELSEGVGTVMLARPEALNAMDTETYAEVTAALERIDADPEVRAGILTGAGGRAFSAGADLKEMHSRPPADAPWKPWAADRWDLGLTVSKPLIAAIDGYAVAGGLELALLCDIRIATPSSQFGAPEVKWNLLHGFGALRLPAVVGLGNAMKLLLSGEFIGAEEALRIGLVNELVEPEELMPSARRLAATIGSRAADAVAMTKELALRGLDTPLDQGMRLYHSYMAALEGNEEQLARTGEFAGSGGDGGRANA
ncbi:MAG TPA: enoyl-CoA hydratase/isomerase family protein [Solirubrobacterales bacterium]|nr:enoyl-CoA hydratase/isomerase family protein [Solirubrobacterales bacterium]